MNKVFRRPSVEAVTGLSCSKIYEEIAAGLPRPVPLGARAVGWLETEISEWIVKCARERDSRSRAVAGRRRPAEQRGKPSADRDAGDLRHDDARRRPHRAPAEASS